jgi:aerobic carbon-monoxide dehydrogenase medium subunit
MKAPAFDYFRPASLGEAIAALSQARGEAQVIAGGQSLVAMMNLRLASPALLVDIARLDELRSVLAGPDDVMLGACITHAAIEDGRVPDPSCGLMPSVAGQIACRAVRTRGTIGGSLALSDPAADWPTVMVALDAGIVLRGPAGTRTVPASGFVLGIYETVRAPEEIVVSLRIPVLGPGARWGYRKFCRKSGEFAESIAAAVHDPARGYARVVLGAVGGPPMLLKLTSEAMRSGDAGAVARAVADDLADHAFDDFQASLHCAMAERAVRQVLADRVAS